MSGSTEPPSSSEWWRDAVIYEIYVRSFADGNDDGLGDLAGIRTRLAELADLGVDAIWLTPFYPSPQADGGYDVSDHRDVDPRFGSLSDFDGVLADAHALGLRVLVDIVPNHTSSAHPWFVAALSSHPGSVERARYLFRDGRGSDGADPPNDWQSQFGGPAWTRVDEIDGSPGQWYLHLFDREQPDLDWTNPEVRSEFESILRFWLDRGVDGFRIDVANGLAKDAEMPDTGERFIAGGLVLAGHPHWDRDEVHDVYRAWRAVSDGYDGDRMFVAEAYLRSPERLARYVRPDELHTAFNFRFLLAPWDAGALRTAIDESIGAMREVGAPPTWVLSNHDVVRHVTRYGGGDLGVARARAALLLMLALPGSAYLYQGDELGLAEVDDLPEELLADPTFLRSGGTERGRDGCRVPIPWTGDDPSFGFSEGATAWLPQPPVWRTLAHHVQRTDPDSTLSLHRIALAERRRNPSLGDGPFEWIESPAGVLAFARCDDFVSVTNLTDTPVPWPGTSGSRPLVPYLSSRPGAPPNPTAEVVPAVSTLWFRPD